MRRGSRLVRLLLPVLLVLAGCGDRAAPADFDKALILALSVFPVGPDGKASVEPGHATLVILRREAGRWSFDTLEDPESNVFHKALPFERPGAPPGILTIGGAGARLKLWRRGSAGWQAETFWAPEFGGKRNRLRDLELADLDGDGRDEIALATHDQGVVAIVDVDGDGEVGVTELDRAPDTFVHEIEVGDVDGDGALEIYTTPSRHNRFDGEPQSGQVMRYRPGRAGGEVFADLGDRHAKEVLLADLDGSGSPEVYVAVEGRVEGGQLTAPVEIRRYGPEGGEGEIIARLDDRLCRFLVPADVDGDGALELLAAPFRSGLWLLRPPADGAAGEWEQISIDTDSSGFEHATAAADLDGDGADEIYVAADDQRAVRRYVWNGSGFDREEIFHVPPALSGFTWNVTAVPVELTR